MILMYWINEWALVRQSEMAYISDEKLTINSEFLHNIDYETFETKFRYIWNLLYKMYGDMSTDPEKFGLPVHPVDKFGYGSIEAGASRRASWEPVKVLMYLFASGEVNGNKFIVDAEKFREYNNVKGNNKIKNIDKKIIALTDYGFVFNGLKNNKVTSSVLSFDIEYPDDPEILLVLHLIAVKTCQRQWNNYSNPFLSWNPRILFDDDINIINTLNDKIKNQADRKFIQKFHECMIENGYQFASGDWNEGPGICYTKRSPKEPYIFRMLKYKLEFQLFMRIRNAVNCLDYVDKCPESVKDIFRSTTNGCGNRHNGCNKGVGYVFEGEEKWKCGCCNAPFIFHPNTNDIPHYLKLIELGLNK